MNSRRIREAEPLEEEDRVLALPLPGYSPHMRNREDSGLQTVPGRILRRRKWIIALLVLNGFLFGVLAFVSWPRILDPIMTIPPNRYFHPTDGMICVANIAVVNRSAAWLFFGFDTIAAGLAWKGWLDRLHRPLLIVLGCSCLGAIACIGYTESLPSWVEKTYGATVRERMFAR